jgi:hypothetical protein
MALGLMCFVAMLLELFGCFVLLGLPMLHHMMYSFHPIKNKNKNQKYAVEKRSQ